MSNFKMKLMGLAAMATAFAGVSFGQAITCVTTPGTTQVNGALRSEGQTELLSLYQFTCTGTAAAAGTTSATITITTNLPVTSKSIGAGLTEATLINGGTPSPTGSGVVTGGAAYSGSVSGNVVTFSGVVINVGPAGVANNFQLTNMRVNASTAAALPFQSSETGLVAYVTSTTGGPTTAFTTIPTTTTSGLVVQSLGAPKIVPGFANYTTCVGNGGPNFTAAAPVNPSFTLNINQLISGAFLLNGPPPVGEQGQYIGGTAASGATAATIGAANTADSINVTLSGLPAGGTVYATTTITVGTANSTTLSIVTPTAPAAGITLPAGVGAAFPVSASGTVTIPYTVTAITGLGAPANSNFASNIVVAFPANTVTTPTVVTANYTYAPNAATITGPAAAVPTFAASNFTAVNASAISLCQTTMLFPFVTNQLGFDTGIAIANTSVDNLGAAGKSVAVAQSGTCTLSFYGPTAPATATVPDPQGSLAAGATHAFTISSIAPGYQGYMIAVCPFNYGHAYAFITYNLTQNNGVAEGYIAEVLGGSRNQTVASGDFAITF